MPYIPRQYDSSNFFRAQAPLPNIINDMDAQRINAYELYDDFYYNRPETFRVTCRGDSDVEIYLPSTKKIVNATARFLGVDFSYSLKGGNLDAVENFIENLFAREEIQRRFIRGKRSLLTRGDLVWYITANPKKPEGKRLTINTIHPSSVFPIEDPDDNSHVKGWHIVDLVPDPREQEMEKGKQVARRQTYRRDRDSQITYDAALFEQGAWDDRFLKPGELKPIQILSRTITFPSEITAFPVYLVPNHEPDGSSWGMSLVAGVEYIINAVNQSITYEDLSLVLQGLGVYVSTAGPPIDPSTNKPGKYKLHPGNVVEIDPGDDFKRVTGVMTLSPFQEHVSTLDRWMMDGAGVPDMATGAIEVSVAQSGISLALKMGPIIAENSDRELALGGKWDQIGYDLLNGWIPAFENLNCGGTKWTTIFDDPMPINRESYVNELIQLSVMNLITLQEVRDKLEAIGYENTEGIVEELYEQMSRRATAQSGMEGMSSGEYDESQVTSQYEEA